MQSNARTLGGPEVGLKKSITQQKIAPDFHYDTAELLGLIADSPRKHTQTLTHTNNKPVS